MKKSILYIFALTIILTSAHGTLPELFDAIYFGSKIDIETLLSKNPDFLLKHLLVNDREGLMTPLKYSKFVKAAPEIISYLESRTLLHVVYFGDWGDLRFIGDYMDCHPSLEIYQYIFDCAYKSHRKAESDLSENKITSWKPFLLDFIQKKYDELYIKKLQEQAAPFLSIAREKSSTDSGSDIQIQGSPLLRHKQQVFLVGSSKWLMDTPESYKKAGRDQKKARRE